MGGAGRIYVWLWRYVWADGDLRVPVVCRAASSTSAGVRRVSLALSVLCLLLLAVTSRVPIADARHVPRVMHLAFFVEVGVLALVGALLVVQVAILPWPLQPESSVLYGFVFFGMAL